MSAGNAQRSGVKRLNLRVFLGHTGAEAWPARHKLPGPLNLRFHDHQLSSNIDKFDLSAAGADLRISAAVAPFRNNRTERAAGPRRTKWRRL